MNFMGMGWMEISVILIVALIIFGPGKLPEVAGQVGKAIRDFRRMTTDLTDEFEKTSGVNIKDIKGTIEQELTGVKNQMTAATDTVKKEMNSATKSVNSTVSSATKKSSTSSTSSTKSKSTTSSSKSTTTKAKALPVATKKDPLADLGFFEEIAPAAENGRHGSIEATSTTSVTASASTNGNGDGHTSKIDADKTVASSVAHDDDEELLPDDALARARRRRQHAGYSRVSS